MTFTISPANWSGRSHPIRPSGSLMSFAEAAIAKRIPLLSLIGLVRRGTVAGDPKKKVVSVASLDAYLETRKR